MRHFWFNTPASIGADAGKAAFCMDNNLEAGMARINEGWD